MAFDKKAYNREYYQRHKNLWKTKYYDGPVGGNSGSNPDYVPRMSGMGGARYGAYGQAKAAEAAGKKYQNPLPPSISESRQTKYGSYGQAKAAEEARKRTTYGMNSRYGSYGQAKAAEEAKKRSVSNKSSFARSGAHGSGMAEQARYRQNFDYSAGEYSRRYRQPLEDLRKRLERIDNTPRQDLRQTTPSGRQKAIRQYRRDQDEKKYILDTLGKISKQASNKDSRILAYGPNNRPIYDVSDEAYRYAKSRSSTPVSEQAKASYARGKATLHYGNGSGKKNGSTKRKSKAKRAANRVAKFIKNLFG